MIIKLIKYFFLNVMIVMSIVSCGKVLEGVNDIKNYDTKTVFVMDFDVKLYANRAYGNEITTLEYFEPLIILSECLTNNDRIYVRLTNGDEGWVDVKYTSYVPKNWIKQMFNDNYYFYLPLNEQMNFIHKKNNTWTSIIYKNEDYYLAHVENLELNYATVKKQYENGIKRELAHDDKKLNWNKEFTYGDYKVNYVITTDDPDGQVIEVFDFIKLTEENQKKYYSFSTTYNRFDPVEQKLNQKKILFSALQSLK